MYHYDKEGKITATGTIDIDIYKIIPPMSTIVCPPKIGKFEELRFNAEEEKWEVIPNYTGITFIDKNGKLHTIIEPGVSPEVNHNQTSPEPVDETDNDTVRDKHISNEMAKRWTDHLTDFAPHEGYIKGVVSRNEPENILEGMVWIQI